MSALTDREVAILGFERQWWKYAGAKEQAIKDLFDLSGTRYYQLLNELIDRPEATVHDPMLVKRLRRLRAERGRAAQQAQVRVSRRLASVPDAPRRATALVRVSKARGRDDLVSPELQRTAIADYATRVGIVVAEWVEALDESASRSKSPWWQRLERAVGQVEAGERDVVLVWKFNRGARHRRNWAVAVDRIEVAGGTIESATEGLDTTTSTGRLARGMLAELAAWESEVKGEQWKEAHARRLANGLPHSGRPRLGYLYEKATGYVPDTAEERTARGLDPDGATAPLVVSLYERFADGDSVRSIVKDLNVAGIRTAAGAQWSAITVYRMLDSGFAAGLIYARAADEHHPGAHPAIVSPDLWERVRRVRRHGRQVAPWSRAPAHLLSGLARCGGCERPMVTSTVRDRSGERRLYYRCPAHAQGQVCPAPCSIRTTLAEDVVRAWVAEQASDLEAAATAAAARVVARTAVRTDRAHWERLVKKHDRQLVQLNLDRAEGLMPDKVAFLEARDQITGDRAAALARLEQLGDDAAALQGDHRPVVRSLDLAWDEMELRGKRQALERLLTAVLVRRRGEGVRVEPLPVWQTP